MPAATTRTLKMYKKSVVFLAVFIDSNQLECIIEDIFTMVQNKKLPENVYQGGRLKGSEVERLERHLAQW